jgi:hypothetical protein
MHLANEKRRNMAFSRVNCSVLLAFFMSFPTVFAETFNPLDAYPPALPNFESTHQIPNAQSPPNAQGTWLGFGGNIYNNHWASSDALVNTNNIGTLQPICQKAYEVGVSAAPLVEDGVAYYPTWGGLLVALDYVNCQVH